MQPVHKIRVEHRDGAPEQALVLRTGGSGRHEHAAAGQYRRLGDGPFAERPGDHVVEIRAVEQPAAGGRTRRLAHRRRQRNVVQRDRRRLGVDLGESLGVVIDAAGSFDALADDFHVAIDDCLALAAELLGDLLADLLQDRRRPKRLPKPD